MDGTQLAYEDECQFNLTEVLYDTNKLAIKGKLLITIVRSFKFVWEFKSSERRLNMLGDKWSIKSKVTWLKG